MAEWFKEGVRIVMLIHRKKDGGQATTDRKSNRIITNNSEEFDAAVRRLKESIADCAMPYRIYSSVNARDVKKAIRMFKIKTVDLEAHGDNQTLYFYTPEVESLPKGLTPKDNPLEAFNLGQATNHFLSCLANPQCKETNLFLIDHDSKNGIGRLVAELDRITDVIEVRETANGYHVITEPYNPALTPDLEIKRDAMLLIDWGKK